jgi:hypothetical protein
MTSHYNILRKIPNFPNYSESTFGYPERTIYCAEDSLIILGPPIHLYAFRPPKSCTVHVSGIPDWATVADVVSVFEDFGKIFTIEMSVAYPKPKGGRRTPQNPISNGSALVTYVSYDGAQKALFCHLTRRIPGKTAYSSCLCSCSNAELNGNHIRTKSMLRHFSALSTAAEWYTEELIMIILHFNMVAGKQQLP